MRRNLAGEISRFTNSSNGRRTNHECEFGLAGSSITSLGRSRNVRRKSADVCTGRAEAKGRGAQLRNALLLNFTHFFGKNATNPGKTYIDTVKFPLDAWFC